MKKSVRQLVRDEIAAISAYPVASADGYIKLDAMENPWPLPVELRQELARTLADVAVNRYPDPSGGTLKAQLKQAFSIPEPADVLLGNGSDELITLVAQTLARPGAKLLALEPSFVMYKMNALFSGLDYIGVPLRSDFSLDLPATLAAIAEHQPAVVFVSYPNNPTGPRFARAEVEAICEAAPGLVVVDEAYQAFASDSFMNLAGLRDNLIVMRTLSKLGLAGIRLGYAAGPAAWIRELDKVRPPYNINVLTQAAARFSLRYLEVFNRQAAELCEERGRLAAGLARYAAVEAFPSEANFITIRVPDAPALYQHFKASGILIKQLHGSHPLLERCLRLTVGTPQENDAMLAALDAYFA
ncbi:MULTISPECIES: histidinol-phosphate transaminase [Chromobacterium]|uniref:Histidinol-phosphate aminotransferase n=1 Tax=Chromobacterium haemolyticum TaxID=394935 RepID=A0ABS3GHB7_9NEIS|nr:MULTISPECIES: histidinol-phosphate transaminase [Chromobacterium]MBK0412875.1 histidinol-phosphate transaminase [Chromobacterium haemolyticum]MBO0413977.1 histidinol-phosphate transaminase [Chromobacterium haemolyticum]MBO0497237.1 histidinol-phosphate transaminase [Chromobacterium haemolyticum]MDH0341847.1 histidinol-phosphate transaminase [Chromobacterium haemolyticum]OQS37076.1 histidinol-phosphate transaminase [Chromobacterium haemolyticum]